MNQSRHLVILAEPHTFDRTGDYLACRTMMIEILRGERRFDEFTTQWPLVTCAACQTTSEYAAMKVRYP
jgi:hypothetical protein